LTPTRRLVVFPPTKYNIYRRNGINQDDDGDDDAYQGRYAKLQAASSTAQDTASSTSDSSEYLGGLRGSYGHVPRKEDFKHCQGTCQAGVCALSPYKDDKCFDY
jgi:hypothetical protein